jgi:hypothetical protein
MNYKLELTLYDNDYNKNAGNSEINLRMGKDADFAMGTVVSNALSYLIPGLVGEAFQDYDAKNNPVVEE